MERQHSQADVSKMIADAIQQEHENLWVEISLQINNVITNHIPSQVDSSVRNYMSGHILHVHPTQASQAFAHEHQYQIYLTMKDNLQLQNDDLPIWLALKIKFEGLQAYNTPFRPSVIRPGDQDDPHDDAHLGGRIVLKGRRHDDELPTEKVSQELVEDMSQTVDDAKLHKVIDEMLRQRCSSRDEHQDPNAPALSLVNQDLLYLNKGNSGPEKIVLSLHKFHAIIFPEYVKKFNPYARFNVKHWNNPHAKILYIKRQKEPRKLNEEVYSNSKIVHEHKFVTKIIARRANGSIVSITEPDYKNLNKNDIEDMYLLCINRKVARCGKLSTKGQSYYTNNYFPCH
ncbi:hypothetical protein Tco_1511712 [Tanacetum coccineum]